MILHFKKHLEGQGDLVRRLTMGIIRVTTVYGLKRSSTYLLSLPDPQSRTCCSYAPKAIEKVSSELGGSAEHRCEGCRGSEDSAGLDSTIGLPSYLMSGFNTFSYN